MISRGFTIVFVALAVLAAVAVAIASSASPLGHDNEETARRAAAIIDAGPAVSVADFFDSLLFSLHLREITRRGRRAPAAACDAAAAVASIDADEPLAAFRLEVRRLERANWLTAAGASFPHERDPLSPGAGGGADMIPVTSFAERKVAVFGLGGSGLVAANALLAGGADVVGWDDNSDRIAHAASGGIPTADLREIDWRRIAALVLAPGVPLTHPEPHWSVALARNAAVDVIGDIELFCRERRIHAPDAPFVAITGTNGKSTTTALIAHLCAAAGLDTQLGGNIGTAILSLAPPAPREAGRVHVIECSSFQIDLAQNLDPSVGVLINLAEDHLDRHGSMANYAAVKERLIAGIPASGTATVGVDDELCQAIADRSERAGRRTVRVSVRGRLADGIYVEAGRILEASGGTAREIARLDGIGALRGRHNAQNAACAAGAALALGLDPRAIQEGLRTFPGLAHRMEEVGRRGAVLFVNDSKATNADSAAQALACFDDIFWIAGGKPKTGGIASLAAFFPRMRKAYLIGAAAPEFAATLDGKVDHVVSGTLDHAVAAAARDAAACGRDAVVLLSPACASYDQFENFEKRGNAFRELVLKLAGVTPIRKA
jgi:UDP-N-acetylmuramoylalanine--D-glutamate ligase